MLALSDARWIEAFCERASPALFLAEPLNVASNLAILAAAMVLARRAVVLRSTSLVPASVQALIALIAVVSMASTLYHVAPMQWSYALDIQAIHIFGLWFAACFARWMLGVPWPTALLAIPLFGGYAWLVEMMLAGNGLDIGRFMPAAIGLPLLAALLWFVDRRSWQPFAGAAMAFALALVFHRSDSALCSSLPIGTHFLWHAFNGITLFLITREVLERSVPVYAHVKRSPKISNRFEDARAFDGRVTAANASTTSTRGSRLSAPD
jgi:hypothetical protein